MTAEESNDLYVRIVHRWSDVLRIANSVPSAVEMAGWLSQVGGATTPEDLGLNREEYELGISSAHYYRARFTVRKLTHLLGM
jgi:glycerol dehydrogenase-like iron-containing ADH family enzyme